MLLGLGSFALGALAAVSYGEAAHHSVSRPEVHDVRPDGDDGAGTFMRGSAWQGGAINTCRDHAIGVAVRSYRNLDEEIMGLEVTGHRNCG
jgi:hypothetical protein